MKDLINSTALHYLAGVVLAALSSAFGLGYWLASADHATVCAGEIIRIEELNADLVKCNQRLTTCEANGVGGAVIDCSKLVDQAVKKALVDYTNVVCSD